MKSVWNKAARENLLHRIDKLTPDTRAKWGKFTAPQMVAHLTEAMRMALGELPVKSRNTIFRRFPIKQFIIYLAPFPKGAPTAPELLAGTPAEWNAAVQTLKETINRFALGNHQRFPEHPAFGTISRRGWGVLAYKHIDHHLKQFGV
jgi:hypothetical protein